MKVIKEFDEQRRVIKLELEGKIPKGFKFNGHSVCNTCEKDMPVVWDVVCYKCNKTFCYDCSASGTISNKWYCKRCILFRVF